MEQASKDISKKQKRFFLVVLAGFFLIVAFCVFVSWEKETPAPKPPEGVRFDLPSLQTKPENIRIANLEQLNDALAERLQFMEKEAALRIEQEEREKERMDQEKKSLSQEIGTLRKELHSLKHQVDQQPISNQVSSYPSFSNEQVEPKAPRFKEWEAFAGKDEHDLLVEIPAGTVFKALLASAADCSVGIHNPTGPNMMLLRPLSDGRLPRNISVALKGSVIIGNAIGNIANERAYIRMERIVIPNGKSSFLETELSGYVSGEDGKEGLRGIVVDRSGGIVGRAFFSAFLSGVTQTVEATLNNQSLDKLKDKSFKKSLTDGDLYRNSALQGGVTAVDRLTDYFIKRAEQVQPVISINAGRVVDIVFTKTVRLGERGLKNRFNQERKLPKQGVQS